ncbi:hypothetical protein EI94DRAFT_1788514 [Lactarius quietus]|nr:hypothetical protein EI94DRAFT_1788514 [Lactarius quietus]
MPTVYPGQIFLTGCATLENRRPVPQKPFTFIYDTIFSCIQPCKDQLDCKGIGSFRHFVGTDTSEKKDGIYEIFAKIVSFQADRNTTSPEHLDDDTNLLGEIISMRQLSVLTKHDLTVCEEPVRILGAGMVTSINRDKLSFVIHALQYTAGGESTDDIAIRAHLDLSPKWTNPAQRLPHTSALIGFTGILHQFETYCPPNSTREVTCAVLALDDITYFPRPSPSIPNAQPKQMIHTKLKSRTEKYTMEASSSTSSLPPRTMLGKRKAETSDDEVNKEILTPVD